MGPVIRGEAFAQPKPIFACPLIVLQCIASVGGFSSQKWGNLA